MSRGVIFDDVTDTSGNALPGISVTIFEEGTTTKATLYDARVGGNNLDNPLTTNDRGIFLAYLEPGSYDISVAAPTGTFVKPGVPALDPDDVNDLNDNIADINAALDLLDDTGALNALQTVDTLAELKALDPATYSGQDRRVIGIGDYTSDGADWVPKSRPLTFEMFGAILDATTTDGTTGTDNTDAITDAINFANARREKLTQGSSRTASTFGYLVGDLPELGSGVVLEGNGDISALLISKPSLTNSFVRVNGNQAGLKNIGIFCNDATKKPYEITGLSSGSLGYQPILDNVLVVGGLDGVSIEDGLEFRQQNSHVVNVSQDAYSVSVPDALLINASSDNAGRFGFRFNGDVVTTMHSHAIRSASSGYRITSATASQLYGDHADTSGGHGFDCNSNNGLRMIAPFAFKSGQDAGFSNPANYNLVSNSESVLIAPMSNQDADADYAFFGFNNSNCLVIAPIDTGTKPSVFDDGLRVAMGVGRLEKYNSLFVSQRKDGIIISSLGSQVFAVTEPEEYSRSFNGFGYDGKIIVRAATQNRILVGRFMIFTGANSGAVASVPITWEYGVTSPDISADITISLAHTSTGADLTIGNASAEDVAVGISVTPFASAKAV